MVRHRTRTICLFVSASIAVLGLSVPSALADGNSVNFESYSTGNINGQDGGR